MNQARANRLRHSIQMTQGFPSSAGGRSFCMTAWLITNRVTTPPTSSYRGTAGPAGHSCRYTAPVYAPHAGRGWSDVGGMCVLHVDCCHG